MGSALNHLKVWLAKHSFSKEASEIELLTKLSAGKPFPLNSAQTKDIAEELVEELGAKMLAHFVRPIDIIGHLLGMGNLPKSTIDELFGTTKRKSKSIDGKELEVEYGLFLASSGSYISGATRKPMTEDGSTPKAGVTIFLGREALNEEELLGALKDFKASSSLRSDFDKNFSRLRELIIDYVVSTLSHEQVHARDVLKLNQEKFFHEVKDPKNETLEILSNKYQITPFKLLLVNIMEFPGDERLGVTPEEERKVRDGLFQIQMGNDRPIHDLYNIYKDIQFPIGYKIYLTQKARSQSLAEKEEETLEDFAKRRGLNIDRLLLINYNDMFADYLSELEGKDYKANSYKDIYNLLANKPVRDYILQTLIPKGMEIKLIPDYMDIYNMSKDFYLLTREESKAHYAQMILEIELKVKGMGPEERSTLSIDEMIQLSPTAAQYLSLKEEHPIDLIIKTPIRGEMLGALKKKRYRDFMLRMVHLWQTTIA